jgi:hypothetical protein
VALVEIGGVIAEELDGVAALDQGEALCQQAFELDRADFRAVLFLLAALLGALVVVELAVHPAGGTVDRRQVLTEAAVVIGEPQSGGVFERLKRAALDLAAIDQKVELAQRRPGVDGFEIVVGAEESLAAGLALALGDGAERIEAAGDGGEKALLGLDVGGDRPEQRRLRLVGAVRAAKALDGGVGLPARFEQVLVTPESALRPFRAPCGDGMPHRAIVSSRPSG